MSVPQHDRTDEVKATRTKVVPPQRAPTAEFEEEAFAELDFLGQHSLGAGRHPNPGAHATRLNQVTAGRPEWAGDALLQLQNQYGNRYVQRVVAAAQPATDTSRRQNNTGLPDRLKSGVEALSGLSMADVRVYYNSSEPARIQALAYTQGTDIHVGPGQERHLAHEAWHVVQQKQGRVRPTLQAEGVAINNDQGLEREADEMGRMAAGAKQGKRTGREDTQQATSDLPTHSREPIRNILMSSTSSVIQCTLQDLIDAQNHWNSFKGNVELVGPNFKEGYQTIAKYYADYYPLQKHYEEIIEATSIGFLHDATEIESKAGGYLYQYRLMLKHLKDHDTKTFYVRAGTSNKNDPDIIVHDRAEQTKTAIEAKRTTTNDYSSHLTNAIEQLFRRDGYVIGRVSIQVTDLNLSKNIRMNHKNTHRDIETRVEGEISSQSRALRRENCLYKTIIVEFRDENMKVIFEHTVNLSSGAGVAGAAARRHIAFGAGPSSAAAAGLSGGAAARSPTWSDAGPSSGPTPMDT